jgi:branched-chain amino acid transport system substrate-binding protein
MHSRRRTSRRAGGAAAALVLALALAACGSSDSSSGDSGSSGGSGGGDKSPIKVASIASETGPAPFTDWATGATAYFKWLNANGGINGRKVDFKIYDDKGDPAQASALARRLVGEGIVAFVGSISLGDCAVNRQYYQQQNIVSIDIGSDATCFNSPNIDPVNSGPMIDPLLQLLYASQELKKKKVCVMAYKVPGEAENVKQAISLWEKLSGLKPTLAIQGFDLNADPTPAVIKFKNAGCEAVSVSADIDTGVPFMKAVGTQNAKDIQWLMGLATYSPQFAKAVGSDGDGMLMGLEYRSFEDPKSKAMLAQFKAAGLPAAMPTVTGWTAAYAFAQAAKGIKGDVTKDSFTKAARALASFEIPSMGTPFSFGAGKSHNPNQAAFFVRLKNGTFEDVSKDFFILPEGTVPR